MPAPITGLLLLTGLLFFEQPLKLKKINSVGSRKENRMQLFKNMLPPLKRALGVSDSRKKYKEENTNRQKGNEQYFARIGCIITAYNLRGGVMRIIIMVGA
jgi:hypothetical protein